MKKITFLFLFFVCIVNTSFATETCVTIDTSSWTPEQKSLRLATAYRLAFEAGEDVLPYLDGDKICFGASFIDVPTVITGQKLLDRMALQKTQNDAEIAQLQVLRNELSTLTTQLESDDINWGSLNTTQRLAVMKKVLRREVLKQKLGQ